MNIVGRRALVVALLVVSMAVAGGLVLTGSSGPLDGVIASQSDADDAGTPSHRDPDEYSGEGDLSSVQKQLAGQLSAQLQRGAVELSESDREQASQYVDEEYREQLREYVEVSGETGTNENLESEFERAGDAQANLSTAVRSYRETKTEYEAAREADNETRTLALARELEAQAQDVETYGAASLEGYETIQAETGTDMSESIAAVENVTEEVRSQQETVRDQQFAATSLTLAADRENVSFREPLVATGELQTADGAPIADREIRLDVGNHTRRVTTDSAGAFTLEYRPTNESLSTTNLTVEYVPRTRSAYLGDEAAVNVSIGQVEPTVSLDAASPEVSYRDNASVAGEVAVDGVPVDNVTLAVEVDGTRIGAVNVTNGTFDETVAVPASISAGEAELRVALPFEERALTAAADATTVTVRETESTLSLGEITADEQAITVTGTLTAAGDGIADEPVELRVDGTTVATVTTRDGGAFRATASIPDAVGTGDATITAVYDGRGSNLEPSRAERTVAIGGPDLGVPTPVLLGGGIVALLGLGLGAWWYRRSDGERADPAGSPRGRWPATDGAADAEGSSDPSPDTVAPLLERASEHLSAGRPDDAARTGYAAVRLALASRLDERDALTHWEFYRTYRDDAPDAKVLHDVTATYERAAFDPGGVSADDAASVLERARQLCDLEEPSDAGVPADD